MFYQSVSSAPLCHHISGHCQPCAVKMISPSLIFLILEKSNLRSQAELGESIDRVSTPMSTWDTWWITDDTEVMTFRYKHCLSCICMLLPPSVWSQMTFFGQKKNIQYTDKNKPLIDFLLICVTCENYMTLYCKEIPD